MMALLLTYRSLVNQLIGALQLANIIPPVMAAYSIVRALPRFWGYALPGQCTDTVINLSFSVGNCVAAGNWLVTRVSQTTSAHAWSWVMYGGFAVAVSLWMRPPDSSITMYGKEYRWLNFNGWRALFITGFTIAVHELLWFGTYFVVHPNPTEVLINLEVYGSFIAFAAIGIVAFWLLGYQKYLDLKLLGLGVGVLLLFYAGWASAGYPLSLDLVVGDKTGLLNDLPTAFIEFCSWLVAFAVVGASYYAKQIRQAN